MNLKAFGLPRLTVSVSGLVRFTLIVLSAYFASRFFSGLRPDMLNLDSQIAWGAGAILLILASATEKPPPDLGARFRAWLLQHRAELVFLGMIVGLAAFMRLYGYGSLPPFHGAGFEENQTGGNAYRILNSGQHPIEFAFTNYAAAAGYALFGDMSGLRVVFLVASILCVIPFYVLLRLMTSQPAALAGASLFAASHWLATSARFADELFFGVSLTVTAALLLIVVLKTGNRAALAGLAVLTGALSYEYVAYRLVPYVIVAALLSACVFRLLRRSRGEGHPLEASKALHSTTIFVLITFVVLTPLVVTSLDGNKVYYESYLRHHDHTSTKAFFGLLPGDWHEKLTDTVKVFLPAGPRDYPSDPASVTLRGRMLDPITASLAIAGLILVILRRRRPYDWIFVAWLLTGLFFAGVLTRNFYVGRFTGLLPTLMVLPALALDALLTLATKVDSPNRRWSYGLAAGLIVVAIAFNFREIDRQLAYPGLAQLYADPLQDTCRMLQAQDQGAYTYIWSEELPADRVFVRSDYDWICHDLRGERVATNSIDLSTARSGAQFLFITRADTTKADAAADPATRLAEINGEFRLLESRTSGSYLMRLFGPVSR